MYIVQVASSQRGKFDILVFSVYHGDANSHILYIIRVASRHRGKFGIIVVTEIHGDVNSHTMYDYLIV